MAPHEDSPQTQSAISGSTKQPNWSEIDEEFRSIIAPIHATLANDDLSTEDAAENFSTALTSHLRHHLVIPDPNTLPSHRSGPHRERAILKLTKRLAKIKNAKRKDFTNDPRDFLTAVRLHNRVKKASEKSKSFRETCRQERAFQNNPWSYSKSICNTTSSKVSPKFSSDTCLSHFKPSFEAQANPSYATLPRWVPETMPLPDTLSSFDLSPIRPREIRSILKKLSKPSAPGPDSISYTHLKRLPSTHHFLATLFSMILLRSQQAPKIWCIGDIRLIHKKGNPKEPENFRPIALTSAVGKLFHRILASRIETYVLQNKIIDPRLQKGFLSGISGVQEHILTVNAIIDNAKEKGLPLCATFVDLRNAFGSIPHKLIHDMLVYIDVPPQIVTYIDNAYSKLIASISTRQWVTPSFKISRGTFQGDTLSPLLFLLCFHPILSYAEKLPSTSSEMTQTLPNSSGLPPPGSFIYVEWNEEASDEEKGWYKCRVVRYLPDCRAVLEYDNYSTEEVSLREVQWHFTRKSSKPFMAMDSNLPVYPLKKVCAEAAKAKTIKLSPRTVLGYADDTTILSKSPEEHQQALIEIDNKCSDLGLEIRPDKCVSLIFNGRSMNKQRTFKIHQGHTRNISSTPTKFLGQTIGITIASTRVHASKGFSTKVYSALEKIDRLPIRGEYKVWIYKSYLVPSLTFNLAVEIISASTIKKIQSKATSYLKRWLKLPKCSTLASLFHPGVCNLPHLPQAQEKAKLRLLAQVHISPDQNLRELENLILDPSFAHRQCIPPICQEIAHIASPQINSNAEPIHLLDSMKNILSKRQCAVWDSHLETLSVQSKFLDIAALEQHSKVWSRIMFGLPAGQLSFLIRAGIDVLPSPANLQRWNIQPDSTCSLCNSRPCTVSHILNGCPTALNQGRYTWRHDSVLSHLLKLIQSTLSEVTIYADLPGHRALNNPPSTIPPSLVATSARPDIVIISGSSIHLLELTVPSNTVKNIMNARVRKQSKTNYIHLVNDLESLGHSVHLHTAELGSLGHFNPETVSEVHSILPSKSKSVIRKDLLDLSKVAITCSKIIFEARLHSDWNTHLELI